MGRAIQVEAKSEAMARRYCAWAERVRCVRRGVYHCFETEEDFRNYTLARRAKHTNYYNTYERPEL